MTRNVDKRRLFIGLALSEQDKSNLAAWYQSHLRDLPNRPVPIDNLHITTSFLGVVDAVNIAAIKAQLSEIKVARFQLQLTELGVFAKPQVLYLGVTAPAALQELAKHSQNINKNFELAIHHREYRPHITLSRKHKTSVPNVTQLPELNLQFEQFHLFESRSSERQGVPPQYLKIASYPLL